MQQPGTAGPGNSLSLLNLFNHAYYRDIGRADIYVKQTEACKSWHLIPILTALLILYNCVFITFLLISLCHSSTSCSPRHRPCTLKPGLGLVREKEYREEIRMQGVKAVSL